MQLFDNLSQEFGAAPDRAIAAQRRANASRAAIEELHHADDIYDTIAEEIRRMGLREPIDGVPPLVELYARLKATEKVIMPTPADWLRGRWHLRSANLAVSLLDIRQTDE